MRHLIIPDIHDKIEVAQRIIDAVPHDKLIFLGDFFDDFPTGAKAAERTARWLKPHLHDSDTEVLMGNHDLSYGWGLDNRDHICSGFTKSKWHAIHGVLKHRDWERFKLHAWVPGPERPWLLSHAGFDHHYLQDGMDLRTTVDARCAAALKSLHEEPNPYFRGHNHAILGAGASRGGRQYKGGILWCDFTELAPPPGANQLVGHTPWREPRVEDFEDAITVCVDTHLNHYAVLEDGYLSVLETARLPVSA